MSNSVPHTSKPRTFRPWPDNQAQFQFAESIRLNVSELINEVVAKHLWRHIKDKIHAQQRAVNSLAPSRGTKPTTHKQRN